MHAFVTLDAFLFPLHNSLLFGSIVTLKDALHLHLSQGHHHQLHSIAPPPSKRIQLLAITTLLMARTLPPYDHFVEEDCIDLDISPITFLCYAISSPPHSGEFEFQVSTNPRDGEATTSPADELFYKGKLLPLDLPPRLPTVQKLLQSSTPPLHGEFSEAFEDKMTTTPPTTSTATSTPFESGNISPDASCCVTRELYSENCCFERSTGLGDSKPKKSWSKRLQLIRQSSLGLTLKASRAYLKSLFNKSGCSGGPCVMAREKNPFGQIHRERYLVAGNSAATLIRSMDGGKPNEEENGHRKSLSGIIKWNLTMKSSSCSSASWSSFASGNSSGYHQPQTLSSSSVNSEVESSIQGAIAYCKKSQQLECARKSASDVGYCSSSAPRIAAACENQESPGLCRG